MLLMLAQPARAQDITNAFDMIDVSRMQAASDAAGGGIDIEESISSIISGEVTPDPEAIVGLVKGFVPELLETARGTLAAFLLPLMVCSLVARLTPRSAPAMGLISGCAVVGIFAGICADSAEKARGLLNGMGGMLEATLPLLTSLSAMGGGTASAALITPMTTLLGDVMVSLMGKWGIGIALCAGVCACAGAICPEMKLSGLSALLKRTVQVGCGLMLALFAGLLKVQGMLGRSFDSAAVKTARFAVDKLVPSVGGGIADTMDAALSSILLVKSAVGITGMAALAVAALGPVAELAARLIGIRIACALCQPVGDPPMIAAASEFADMIRLLVVICASALTMCLVLTGAAIGAGRSLGG